RVGLVVARGRLLKTRVARYPFEGRVVAWDVAAFSSDDDGELPFVVVLRRAARTYERLIVPDERIGEAREDRRVCERGSPRLGAVVEVVHADAEDLARIGDDGCVDEVIEGEVRPARGDERAHLVEPRCGEDGAHAA